MRFHFRAGSKEAPFQPRFSDMGAPAGNQIQAKGSLQTLNRQNNLAKQSRRKAAWSGPGLAALPAARQRTHRTSRATDMPLQRAGANAGWRSQFLTSAHFSSCARSPARFSFRSLGGIRRMTSDTQVSRARTFVVTALGIATLLCATLYFLKAH